MKVDHKFMGSEALVRSYHIAGSQGNWELVREIEDILKSRGESHMIPKHVANLKPNAEESGWPKAPSSFEDGWPKSGV